MAGEDGTGQQVRGDRAKLVDTEFGDVSGEGIRLGRRVIDPWMPDEAD